MAAKEGSVSHAADELRPAPPLREIAAYRLMGWKLDRRYAAWITDDVTSGRNLRWKLLTCSVLIGGTQLLVRWSLGRRSSPPFSTLLTVAPTVVGVAVGTNAVAARLTPRLGWSSSSGVALSAGGDARNRAEECVRAAGRDDAGPVLFVPPPAPAVAPGVVRLGDAIEREIVDVVADCSSGVVASAQVPGSLSFVVNPPRVTVAVADGPNGSVTFEGRVAEVREGEVLLAGTLRAVGGGAGTLQIAARVPCRAPALSRVAGTRLLQRR